MIHREGPRGDRMTVEVELTQPRAPVAVVVLFEGAFQVTTVDGPVDRAQVADALVQAAFKLAEVRPPAGPDDEVYDVERDGGAP